MVCYHIEMKYLDGICIFILIIILILCLKLSWYKEGFDVVYQRIKSGVIENDIIDSKYMKDEKNMKTEISFYVNDQIPTPTTPPTLAPIVLTCTPNIITLTKPVTTYITPKVGGTQSVQDLLIQLQKMGLLGNKSSSGSNTDIQSIIQTLTKMGIIGGSSGNSPTNSGGGGGISTKDIQSIIQSLITMGYIGGGGGGNSTGSNIDMQTIIQNLINMGFISNGGSSGASGGDITNNTTSTMETSIINTEPTIPQIAPKSTTSLQYYYTFESGLINSSGKLVNMAINYPDAFVNNVTINNDVFIVGNSSGYFNNINTVVSKTLDKNAQYIACPTLNTIDYTNGLSIALWINPIKPTGLKSYYIALCLGSSYDDNIYIGYSNEALYYGMNGIDGYANGLLPSNTWTHVVWTIHPDGKHTIYVNGKSIGIPDTDTITYFSGHDYPLILGYNYAGISQNLADYYNGYLDDIRIYNRELKSTEAQALYNKTNIT